MFLVRTALTAPSPVRGGMNTPRLRSLSRRRKTSALHVPPRGAAASQAVTGSPGASHSYLKAIIGSTFVARRAGMKQARSAAAASTDATPPKTSGSVAETP